MMKEAPIPRRREDAARAIESDDDDDDSVDGAPTTALSSGRFFREGIYASRAAESIYRKKRARNEWYCLITWRSYLFLASPLGFDCRPGRRSINVDEEETLAGARTRVHTCERDNQFLSARLRKGKPRTGAP